MSLENEAKTVETVFRFNGKEFEFDARDADMQEKLEDAVSKLAEDEKGIPKDGKASTMIRGQCAMMKKFFDRCLGEGTGIAVCTERDNIRVCYDAYDAFLQLVSAQKEDTIGAKNIFAKYSNRQQRRAAEKK